MEALEHLLARILGDAGAFVAYGQLDPAILDPDRDVDRAVGRRERHSVVEQVLDHAFEPHRLTHDRYAHLRQVQIDRPPFVLGAVLACADDAANQLREIDRLERGA